VKARDIFIAEDLERFITVVAMVVLPVAAVVQQVMEFRQGVVDPILGSRWLADGYLVVAAVCLYLLVMMLALIGLSALVLPIHDRAARRNGGPFRVGDRVMFLTRRRYGEESEIYSLWQGHTFRVRVSDEAERSFHDIFRAHQVRLVRRADQMVARSAAEPSTG
jgi:hypothetical protein